jgi:hypothetical protein
MVISVSMRGIATAGGPLPSFPASVAADCDILNKQYKRGINTTKISLQNRDKKGEVS